MGLQFYPVRHTNRTMKSLFVLALALVACQALDLETEWEAFKVKHGKTYLSATHHDERKSVFADNLARIESHNADHASSHHRLEGPERRDSGEGPGSVRILLVVLRHREPRLRLRAAADGLRHQQQRLQRRKPLPRSHVRPPQRRNRHRGLLPLRDQEVLLQGLQRN